MITRLKNRLNKFRSEENGGIYTLEFAVMLPLLCFTLAYGVELTTHANRQFQIERGLEVTTRIIRLNTGEAMTHAMLLESICDNAGGLDDCSQNMRLEMQAVVPREFVGLPANPDCTNAPLEVTPVRGWSLGEQHELMLLRACYQYTPFMSTLSDGVKSFIGVTTASSKGYMVAMSAFVQEPQ
jgi:hypothetical protein